MSEVVATATTELVADDSKLLRGLKDSESAVKASAQTGEKAYGDSGKKAGGLFGVGVAGGLKILGAGASLAFGIATKGAIELEDQVAEFRAETGASAEEADRAGKAINRMSGSNIQPMKEIGSALIAVHTQMGLTGAEAERTTQDFLTFGRATRQDASTAVKAFDDILDAWGLTAKDSRGIMDQLVVSHQKFGGSIEENQAALAAMAPALKAMNLTVDDGVGLLNIFASSGLDASTAQRALNAAVQNLPPGENLRTVIDRLTKIEDPAVRAQEAVKIFGARAGVGLANAIKPGMKGLSDFIVTANQSAGASQKAADAMNSSFGAQIQLKIKQFGAALTDLGTKFGPLLTGLASVGTLAGALGIDDIARSLGPKFTAIFRDLGKRGADAVASGFDDVMSGAEGTIIGNLMANAIERAGGSRIRAVGILLGTAFTTAFAIAMKIGDAVASSLLGMPAGTVGQAAGAAGTRIGVLFGSTAGTAAGAALRAGLLGAVLLAADPALAAAKDLGRKVHDSVFGPSTGPGLLDTLQWPLGNANPPDWAVAAGLAKSESARIGGSAKTGLADGIKGVEKLIPEVMTTIGQAMRDDADIKSASGKIGSDIHTPIAGGADKARSAVFTALQTMTSDLQTARNQLVQIANGAASAIWDPQIKAAQLAQTKIDLAEQQRIINDKKSTSDQVREAKLRTAQLQQQLFTQVTDIATYGTDAQQTAKIKAALASKEVANAYKNGTPEQRAAIDLWRQAMNDKLTEIEGRAKTGGANAGSNYSGSLAGKAGAAGHAAATVVGPVTAAFKSSEGTAGASGLNVGGNFGDGVGSRKNKTDAGTAGRGVAESATHPLNTAANGAYGWGSDIGSSFKSGLASWITAVGNAAKDIAGAVWKWLHSSVPERASPLYDVYFSGAHVAKGFADSMLAEAGTVARAASTVADAASIAMSPSLAAMGRSSASYAIPAGNTMTVNAPVTVNLPVGWRGGPAEIAALADQLANHLRMTMAPRTIG